MMRACSALCTWHVGLLLDDLLSNTDVILETVVTAGHLRLMKLIMLTVALGFEFDMYAVDMYAIDYLHK